MAGALMHGDGDGSGAGDGDRTCWRAPGLRARALALRPSRLRDSPYHSLARALARDRRGARPRCRSIRGRGDVSRGGGSRRRGRAVRLLRAVRTLAAIAAAVGCAWWACAGPVAPLLPGLAAVACLAWLVLQDLRWAPDALWEDETRLDRDMTVARWGVGRERLCATRPDDE